MEDGTCPSLAVATVRLSDVPVLLNLPPFPHTQHSLDQYLNSPK